MGKYKKFTSTSGAILIMFLMSSMVSISINYMNTFMDRRGFSAQVHGYLYKEGQEAFNVSMRLAQGVLGADELSGIFTAVGNNLPPAIIELIIKKVKMKDSSDARDSLGVQTQICTGLTQVWQIESEIPNMSQLEMKTAQEEFKKAKAHLAPAVAGARKLISKQEVAKKTASPAGNPTDISVPEQEGK